MTWMQINQQLVKASYSPVFNGHVIPGLGGKVLFTGQGMFTSIGGQRTFEGNPPVRTTGNTEYPGSDPKGSYLPAHHSDYYLSLGTAAPAGGKGGSLDVAVHRLGRDALLAHLSGIDIRMSVSGNVSFPANRGRRPVPALGAETSELTVDKRLHLIPEGKVLIVIPDSNDRLVLHRLDPGATTDRAKGEKK